MSLTQTLFKYQFDPTGTSELNLVAFEEVSFTTNSIIPFPAREGMFYTKGVLIKDKATSRILGRDEYNFIAIDQYLTVQTGKEVAGAIELVNNNFVGDLAFTYQCVGGAEGKSNSLVRKLIDAIEGAANGGEWSWELIQNKPSLFPPSAHTHPLSTLSDLGTLKQALEDVANAMINRQPLNQSPLEYQEQIDRIIKIQGEMQNSISRVALRAGSTEQLTTLENAIENIHRSNDASIDLTAGDYGTIAEWVVASGISAKGSLIFTNGTDVETAEFSVVWTADKAPKITTYGNVRTSNKLIEIVAIKTDGKIKINVKPTSSGSLKLKWKEFI